MERKIVNVNWRECEKTGSYTFATDMEHVVRVTKQSLPIVFVPGIMGSRLTGPNGKVWDPDSGKFMVGDYILTDAKKHWQLLIKDKDALQVITPENSPNDAKKLTNSFFGSTDLGLNWDWLPLPAFGPPGHPMYQVMDRRQKIAEILVKQGWGQIALGFYKKILFQLAGANFGPLHRCFVFPVYARGYNWVGDNDISGAYLATEIHKVIQAENSIPGRQCEKVILVTHSMGGLASRSAIVKHGAEAMSYGAIHGAQPVTGAPAAYRRMRGGAEGWFSPASYVQGHTSTLVLPVLGGCEGGLELLPTKLYKDDKGNPAWLTQTEKSGKIMGGALPASGNPYSEIYTADQPFLRLVLHPELLTPDREAAEVDHKRGGREEKPLDKFKASVRKAEIFHDGLQLSAHKETAFSYVGDGMATYDRIDYKFLHQHDPPQQVMTPDGFPVTVSNDEKEGSGTDLDTTHGQPTYYRMEGPTGTGDGTVPVSSGKALPTSFRAPPSISGTEHGAFYDNQTAQQFTVNCIAMLAEKYRKSEVGR